MGFLEFLQMLFCGYDGSGKVTKEPPECPNCSAGLGKRFCGVGEVYYCSICEGLWVEQEQLGELLTAPDEMVQAFLVEAKDTSHTYQRSYESRVCPSCDELMDNYQFNYSSGIWIDACPNQHGVWLDGGELVLLRACRRQMDQQELTEEEKFKMAAALLDGASTTRGNFNKINKQVRYEWIRRHIRPQDWHWYGYDGDDLY